MFWAELARATPGSSPQLPLPTTGAARHPNCCRAYDSASGQGGPASVTVSVDMTTYAVNHAPVAILTVTPTFAGAPAAVTLDASAS